MGHYFLDTRYLLRAPNLRRAHRYTRQTRVRFVPKIKEIIFNLIGLYQGVFNSTVQFKLTINARAAVDILWLLLSNYLILYRCDEPIDVP